MSQNSVMSVLNASYDVKDLAASIYQPLRDDPREIRLMTSDPGNFDDELCCGLSNCSLDDCPSYEALSYVWGDSGSNCQMIVNQKHKPITQNLDAALRHLRDATSARVLWVDAVCINQNDIPERNTQVLHMGDVYRKASRVVAWLGPEDEDSNLAFDALQALPTDEGVHWDFEKSHYIQSRLLEAEYVTAIERLCSRPWWRRMWTVQESILGRDLILICGTRQIHTDVVCSISHAYYMHIMGCCRQSIWKIQSGSKLVQPMQMLNRFKNSRAGGDHRNIVQLLSNYRSRDCVDPRDKIYGLLGLCRGEEEIPTSPDYSLSVSLVYQQATYKIIQRKQSLAILSQVYPRDLQNPESSIADLPSWVPDWTVKMEEQQFWNLDIRQYIIESHKASSSSLASIRHVKEGSIAVQGIILDSLVQLGPQNSLTKVGKDLVNSWREIARIETLPDRLYKSRNSETYYDAFCQTLCCSKLATPKDPFRTYIASEYRPWHDAWWTWMTDFDENSDRLDSVSTEYPGSDILSFHAYVNVFTCLRRLFISDNEEWLGFAPMSAMIGDVIAIMQGGPVPYILRPRSDLPPGHYEFVGDAYVHGIMDGEKWDPDLLQEIILV